MIEITDTKLFQIVVAEAVGAVGQASLAMGSKRRWVNAIGKAAAKLEGSQSHFVEYDAESDLMHIWSETSGNCYTVNGRCECRAELEGVPCYHKAMKRLWVNYLAKLNADAKTEDAVLEQEEFNSEEEAPLYLRDSGIDKPTEKIGNIRI